MTFFTFVLTRVPAPRTHAAMSAATRPATNSERFIKCSFFRCSFLIEPQGTRILHPAGYPLLASFARTGIPRTHPCGLSQP